MDDHISQDCLLLWLMDAPELCLRVLVAIESRLGGWCKLATKTGDQGDYVRVSWEGRGGHDLVEVHQLALWSTSKCREGDLDEMLRILGNSNASHRLTCGHSVSGPSKRLDLSQHTWMSSSSKLYS